MAALKEGKELVAFAAALRALVTPSKPPASTSELEMKTAENQRCGVTDPPF